jgi:putative Holliday junction resolvase
MPSVERYLGIDFGTKRIGIAVGQTLTQTATPLITLQTNQPDFWAQFQEIISTWSPQGLIVGLALQPDGSSSPISESALQFGRHLSKRFKVPVYFIEERLTSVEARQILKENPHLTKQHDKDTLAAALILESWFHQFSKDHPSHVT